MGTVHWTWLDNIALIVPTLLAEQGTRVVDSRIAIRINFKSLALLATSLAIGSPFQAASLATSFLVTSLATTFLAIPSSVEDVLAASYRAITSWVAAYLVASTSTFASAFGHCC